MSELPFDVRTLLREEAKFSSSPVVGDELHLVADRFYYEAAKNLGGDPVPGKPGFSFAKAVYWSPRPCRPEVMYCVHPDGRVYKWAERYEEDWGWTGLRAGGWQKSWSVDPLNPPPYVMGVPRHTGDDFIAYVPDF
jgi:hypothetical protein